MAVSVKTGMTQLDCSLENTAELLGPLPQTAAQILGEWSGTDPGDPWW